MNGRGGMSPRWAAAISVLVVAIAVYAAFAQRVPFTGRYELSGLFASSQGVIKGSPVRIAGVDVGEVTGVKRGPGATAEVKFALDEGHRTLYKNTRMRLRPRVFLEGGFYIELHPGTASSGRLDEGMTVPLPQTSIAVQSDQILSTLDSPTRESGRTVVREFARGLSGGGAEDLGSVTKHLPRLLRTGALVAGAARGRRVGDVSKLIARAAEVSSTLESQGHRLGGLIDNGERTTRAFAQRSEALRSTLRLADATLAEAPGTLDAVDRALPPTRDFLSEFRPALDRLPPTLSRAGRVLDQVSEVSRRDRLPRLLASLGPAVRRLPALERRLVPLFDLVGPVSRCAADQPLKVLKSKLDDGNLSTGRPVWQDLTSGLVGSAGTHSSFDGNGSWERFQGGLSERVFSTGDVPGIGTLVGSTELPLIGTRPRWNGPTPPPFRPDADCERQPAPDLRADVGPVEATRPAPKAQRPTAKERAQLLRRLGAPPNLGRQR